MNSGNPRLILFLAYFCWGMGLFLVVLSSVAVVGWIGVQGNRELLHHSVGYVPPVLTLVWIFIQILIGIVGSVLLRLGKRLGIKARISSSENDTRSPVLYLRSFKADRKMANLGGFNLFAWMRLATEEEQFAEALSEIGPVIAVGRPGEFLPPLGAERIYINNEDWKKRITQLMLKARLVVIVHGTTPGLRLGV